jgi:hypothetical protein
MTAKEQKNISKADLVLPFDSKKNQEKYIISGIMLDGMI